MTAKFHAGFTFPVELSRVLITSLGVLRHLTLKPDKTRIVYCRDDRRQDSYPETSFDFLGYTFRGRPARTRQGTLFIGFNPAVSRKSLKAMNAKVRSWRVNTRIHDTLETLAEAINPVVRGWIQYIERFNVGQLFVLLRRLELRFARWARRKYKHLRGCPKQSQVFIRRMRTAKPGLFVHWQALYTGRMAQ